MLENLTALWDDLLLLHTPWGRLAAAALVVVFTLLVRGLFARTIFRFFLRLSGKTGTDLDRELLLALEGPLKALILVAGIYWALGVLAPGPVLALAVTRLARTAVIVCVIWAFYNLVGGKAYRRFSEQLKLDRIIAEFATKVLRFIIIALGLSVIAQEWQYDVSGFLAGLGLGGLAFALAAKDAVGNIFGGIIIILDKPFDVGDWILTPSVEGTVEEISFRSTRVRTFANALVTVPNSSIANEAITNWTRMRKRQVSFHLGLTYTTPRDKLETAVRRIKAMIEEQPTVHPDTIMVRFHSFNDSSLDLFIYFFTKTTVWAEYLEHREAINFRILEILEEEGISIAFPSRSLYFENALPREPGPGREGV